MPFARGKYESLVRDPTPIFLKIVCHLGLGLSHPNKMQAKKQTKNTHTNKFQPLRFCFFLETEQTIWGVCISPQSSRPKLNPSNRTKKVTVGWVGFESQMKKPIETQGADLSILDLLVWWLGTEITK